MSKEEYAVEVENISKIYTLRNKNNQYKTDKKEFYALKDVSFKIKKAMWLEFLELMDLVNLHYLYYYQVFLKLIVEP